MSSQNLSKKQVSNNDESSKPLEKLNPTWADSLSKNIIQSVTLEIGNPVSNGYNYIKQVHHNDDMLKVGKEGHDQRKQNN